MSSAHPLPSSRAMAWTRERLDRLATPELLNLQANASRLNEPQLAGLCGELLGTRPRHGGSQSTPGESGRLLPLSSAFAARRVWLGDASRSWSGVRKADGMAVIALWRRSIDSVAGGGGACLLWAPNVDGRRPWSDTAAGKARLEHCKAALDRGRAEGLVVHGESFADRLPEDRARTVLGVEADKVLAMRVELRDKEYWAAWGDKVAASKPTAWIFTS